MTPSIRPPGPPDIVLLDGGIQNYAWGTTHEIPEFLGVPTTDRPVAEWWLGAHQTLPSTVRDLQGPENGKSLRQVIAEDPVLWLGDAADQFRGELPFLLKFLSIGAPLSLQVHPSLTQAREGFERENAAGLSLTSPNRNYRDPNHKPELIVALRPMTVLCGFARPADSTALLRKIGAVDETLTGFATTLESDSSESSIRDLVRRILTATTEQATRWTNVVAERARSAGANYLHEIALRYPGDPGVIVAVLLNHVVLAPGEGLFLQAGQLHAYLSGFGIELLANSDNVLRGGLTPKHVDVPELLDTIRPIAESADVLRPESLGAHVVGWRTSAADFSLRRVDLESVHDAAQLGVDAGPRIVVCTGGLIDLRVGETGQTQTLRQGEVAYVRPNADLTLETEGRGTAFVASISQAKLNN